MRGGCGSEARDGVPGVGEGPGFSGQGCERIGRGKGGFASRGGNGLEPERVLLGVVEKEAGFDARDDGFRPEVI